MTGFYTKYNEWGNRFRYLTNGIEGGKISEHDEVNLVRDMKIHPFIHFCVWFETY